MARRYSFSATATVAVSRADLGNHTLDTLIAMAIAIAKAAGRASEGPHFTG